MIGQRAVERLVGLAADSKSSPAARVAAFRTLEDIGEPACVEPALRGVRRCGHSVAMAALSTAKAFLRTPTGVEALDRVIAVALERRRPVAVRVAAIQALRELPAATVKPVLTALRADPDPGNRERPRTGAEPRRGRYRSAIGESPPTERCRTTLTVLKSAIARSSADVPCRCFTESSNAFAFTREPRRAPGGLDGGSCRRPSGAGQPRQPPRRCTICGKRLNRCGNGSRLNFSPPSPRLATPVVWNQLRRAYATATPWRRLVTPPSGGGIPRDCRAAKRSHDGTQPPRKSRDAGREHGSRSSR